MKIATITIGDKEYNVKIAVTPEERKIGLMEVDYLGDNEGMLFFFDEIQDDVVFWMKNTSIALDICFISEEKKVISVKDGVPFSEDPIVESNVKYVLEVPKGSEISVGDEIAIVDDQQDQKEEDDPKENSVKEVVKEVIEEFLDLTLPSQEDSSDDDAISDDFVMYILGPKGEIQYETGVGAKVVSRKETKILIKKAVIAKKTKSDSDLISLGRYMMNVIKGQNNRPEDFIELQTSKD